MSNDDEASNRVEQTFVVAVPIERAWTAFTDGAERAQWEAPEYEIDARPGGKVRWTIPPWPSVHGEVLEVDPGRRLVATEGEGVLDGTTRVTVTFESVGSGTRITVVQAGFGTGAQWQDQLEGHRHGWARAIRDLILYLETGVASRRFFTVWRCDLGMFLTETAAGVRVTEVVAGGWAAEAGVRIGDVVLYLDGVPIFERPDLWVFQTSRRPGDRLDIEVARGAQRVEGTGALRAIA
jgi:uncharacterized protein YndB with AHSA1/START domain